MSEVGRVTWGCHSVGSSRTNPFQKRLIKQLLMQKERKRKDPFPIACYLEAGQVVANDTLLPDLLCSLGRLRQLAWLPLRLGLQRRLPGLVLGLRRDSRGVSLPATPQGRARPSCNGGSPLHQRVGRGKRRRGLVQMSLSQGSSRPAARLPREPPQPWPDSFRLPAR